MATSSPFLASQWMSGLGRMAVPSTPDPDTENQQRMWAAAIMNGGYTSPRNTLANQRIADMDLQAQARRQLADRAFQEQMAYRKATAPPPLVRNGVAYMNGQPVGFVGSVPGVAPGIPEGGFTGGERDAFQRQARNYMQQGSRAMVGPVNQEPPGPVMAQMGGPRSNLSLAPAPMGSVVAGTRTNVSAPDPLAAAVSRAPKMSTIARQAMGTVAGTVQERLESKENTDRGLKSRGQLEIFQAQVPTLTKALTDELGVAIDEDTVAEEIINAWSEGRKTPDQLRKMNPAALKRISELAGQLGVETKVLLRWAQDRKKKT